MVDEGRGTATSARWRLVVTLAALLLGLLLGLVIPHSYRWPRASTPPVASVGAAVPFGLSDWEYPGAITVHKSEGGSSEVKRSGVPTAAAYAPSFYSYKTTDLLETVWGHYAKLAGIGVQEFKPGTLSATGDFAGNFSSSGGSVAMGGVLYSMGDQDRPSVRSATIVAQRPGYSVAIFLSRGKDEDQTHVSIVVEKKPLPLAP